jgi:hypothetical protein
MNDDAAGTTTYQDTRWFPAPSLRRRFLLLTTLVFAANLLPARSRNSQAGCKVQAYMRCPHGNLLAEVCERVWCAEDAEDAEERFTHAAIRPTRPCGLM